MCTYTHVCPYTFGAHQPLKRRLRAEAPLSCAFELRGEFVRVGSLGGTARSARVTLGPMGVYVNTYVYCICMYMYLYMYVYVFVYACICICICMYMYLYMHVYVFVYVCICICMHTARSARVLSGRLAQSVSRWSAPHCSPCHASTEEPLLLLPVNVSRVETLGTRYQL
jgi:hypothetical protein